MADIQIQKTHYETVRKLLNDHEIIPDHDFKETMETFESFCGRNPTYEHFCATPYIQEIFTSSMTENQETRCQCLTMTTILFHIYNLYHNHDRMYYVCPKLAANLAMTNLDVDMHFLQSPFPEIYIQIDPGLFFITDFQNPGTEFPVRGFYINFRETAGIKVVRILVTALSTSYSKINRKNDDVVFYFKIPLGPGKVKSAFHAHLEKISKNEQELKQFGGWDNIGHMEELFFFIFNALLYITSRDADIISQLPHDFGKEILAKKNPAKIRKLMQKQDKVTSLPVQILGLKTQSSVTMEGIKSAGGLEKWKLGKKVYVSGYWRAQWYGSEKDGTRHSDIIFISPYEKGPDMAEVMDKLYQVGKE